MSHKVEIYTKDWCGYCRAAKQLLEQLQLTYQEIDVTHDQLKLTEMLNRSEGRTTVPQIFIDDKGVGGYTDLYQIVQQSSQQQ